MKYLKYIFCSILSVIISCAPENKEMSEKQLEKAQCPCDSIGKFKEKGNNVMYCYIGKSQISIKSKPDNDTVDVTRFYTEDSVWHVQEYLIIANGKIVEPEYAMYCNFSDSLDNYKLTFIRDESLKRNPELTLQNFLGMEVLVNGNTFKSKQNSILIPKNVFKGKVQITKKISGVYKGEKGYMDQNLTVFAEDLIKYGGLDKQYNLISKLCR